MVQFIGNGYTTKRRIKDFALLRAIEACQYDPGKGYSALIIKLEGEISRSGQSLVIPGSTVQTSTYIYRGADVPVSFTVRGYWFHVRCTRDSGKGMSSVNLELEKSRIKHDYGLY